MAAKKKQQDNAKKSLIVGQYPDEKPDAAIARVITQPETQAGLTIRTWQAGTLPEEIDINATIDELKAQTKALKAGDMSRAESMLLAHAQVLHELFNNLARKAQHCEYLSQFEANLKLALKAQNQCRMTLETLSNIKNPPVVYAKQANIAHGPQQVNNGPHAAENQNQQNKLLSVNHGETLDSIGTKQAIGGNSEMAAMG